ncbi:MAG: Rdx family protein [Terriglobales bacterium]
MLLTFKHEVGGGNPDTAHGRYFRNTCGSTLLWSRKDQGGFPEIKGLRRLVRDHIAPGKDLGQIDR